MRNRLFAISLVAIQLLLGCQLEPEAPERLPSIPKTAVWAGGVDGGAWLDCSLDKAKNANWCTVWDDQIGEICARTHFVLRETGEPVPESELSYTGFNGSYIGLADGRWLEPLKFHENPDHDPWEPTPIEPPREVNR